MRPPSHCGGRPLMKRKRTTSEDEDAENDITLLKESQNTTPAEAWGAPELSEGDAAEGLLSPDSIPSSELGLGSPLRSPPLSPSDELTASEGCEPPSDTSECPGSSSCAYVPVPVPALSWADPRAVWGMMCSKDETSHGQRDEHLFSRHPGLTPRMRAILLDWLIEVCEVYKLHRQTYHLCMDYIDRYLSCQRGVPKQQLQLIGITCLFIAAKVEEIYPPKIKEFAYVTDGACTEEEITDKELVILKVLQWGLGPVTALGWLCVFLQTLSHLQQRAMDTDAPSPPTWDSGVTQSRTTTAFELPQFSGAALSSAAALLDLAMLDEGSLRFRYAPLAAAALTHTCGREMALVVSGLLWEEVGPCAQWMQPFAQVLHEACPSAAMGVPALVPWDPSQNAVPRLVQDDSHNIQVHAIDLRLLESAQARRRAPSPVEESPRGGVCVAPGLLTPPTSGKKPLNSTPNPCATQVL